MRIYECSHLSKIAYYLTAPQDLSMDLDDIDETLSLRIVDSNEVVSVQQARFIRVRALEGCNAECIACHFTELYLRDLDPDHVSAVLESHFDLTSLPSHGAQLVDFADPEGRYGVVFIPDGIYHMIISMAEFHPVDDIRFFINLRWDLTLLNDHIGAVLNHWTEQLPRNEDGVPVYPTYLDPAPHDGNRMEDLPLLPYSPRNGGRPRTSFSRPPPLYSPRPSYNGVTLTHPREVVAENGHQAPHYPAGQVPSPPGYEFAPSYSPPSGNPSVVQQTPPRTPEGRDIRRPSPLRSLRTTPLEQELESPSPLDLNDSGPTIFDGPQTETSSIFTGEDFLRNRRARRRSERSNAPSPSPQPASRHRGAQQPSPSSSRRSSINRIIDHYLQPLPDLSRDLGPAPNQVEQASNGERDDQVDRQFLSASVFGQGVPSTYRLEPHSFRRPLGLFQHDPNHLTALRSRTRHRMSIAQSIENRLNDRIPTVPDSGSRTRSISSSSASSDSDTSSQSEARLPVLQNFVLIYPEDMADAPPYPAGAFVAVRSSGSVTHYVTFDPVARGVLEMTAYRRRALTYEELHHADHSISHINSHLASSNWGELYSYISFPNRDLTDLDPEGDADDEIDDSDDSSLDEGELRNDEDMMDVDAPSTTDASVLTVNRHSPTSSNDSSSADNQTELDGDGGVRLPHASANNSEAQR